jgi:hypothetical protein
LVKLWAGAGSLQPRAALHTSEVTATEQGGDGFAVKPCASLPIYVYQGPPNKKRISEHERNRGRRIELRGVDFARFQTRGEAGLNHEASGVTPKKRHKVSAVQGSASRFLVVTV